MSLKTRLAMIEARRKLEERKLGLAGGRCAMCRMRKGAIIYREIDGARIAEPGLEGDVEDADPCPGCGWQPLHIVVVYDSVDGVIDDLLIVGENTNENDN